MTEISADQSEQRERYLSRYKAVLSPQDHSQGTTLATLGYEEFASRVGLSAKTIRNYWSRDVRRGGPSLLPAPAAMVGSLPGWTEAQVRAWPNDRVGPGNHTRGAERRGGPPPGPRGPRRKVPA